VNGPATRAGWPLGKAPICVSVILCVHNGADTIGAQLDALAAQDYSGPWELVIVDDGSTDRTRTVIEEHTGVSCVRTVDNTRGRGLVRARNAGTEAARGDLLTHCDADDVADPGWLSALVRACASAGAAGGALDESTLNDDETRSWRPAATPGCLPVAFGRVAVPMGANFAVWRTVHDEVGGFDEALDYSGEEVDYFWRVAAAGYRIQFAPDAVIHYRLRPSMSATRRQAYRYGRGNVAVFAKHRTDGLAATTAAETARWIVVVLRGVPGAVVSGRRRGSWLRLASYLAGQIVESRRLGVWHLG
jgi:glycosyltransferase involved in cell wall biosynthesis